jgi:addiction module HigA family antidote
MQMYQPAHPGEVLKELYLEPLQLTVTDVAKALGVTRKALSELANGRAGISTQMALRLGKAFGTTPELWLNMQQNYDLWLARKKVSLSKVKVLFSAEPSFSS